MNSYEAKQAARKARLEQMSSDASAKSNLVFRHARKMGEAIPFGQPILVGHHSEGQDRRYRARIHDTFGKAVALSDRADHYAQKAAAVGTGGISSDDPDALVKLRREVEALETTQARMKAANKAIRTHKTPEAQLAALVAQGFTETQAGKLLEKDFCGRIGFPDYALKNNNANIRRIKARVAELEQRRKRADVEQVGATYTYREDTAENRVMFLFEGKPDQDTRALLKRHGFHWSPSRDGQPWVRQLSNAGLWAAQQVRAALDKSGE